MFSQEEYVYEASVNFFIGWIVLKSIPSSDGDMIDGEMIGNSFQKRSKRQRTCRTPPPPDRR